MRCRWRLNVMAANCGYYIVKHFVVYDIIRHVRFRRRAEKSHGI
jgi:hypothetical protein